MAINRVEHDPLGAVDVPGDRLYGAQTARAVANFPLSGRSIAEMPTLLVALAQVKKAAALANGGAGELDPSIVPAIIAACNDIIEGRLRSEFVVDVYQGGAGTSTNMNMNEVLANPSAYGFTNVEEACFANGTVCATPSEYLYWDRLHPTTRGHYLFAQGMARALAVPGPLPIGGTLALFAWSRKLRQRCRSRWHGEG